MLFPLLFDPNASRNQMLEMGETSLLPDHAEFFFYGNNLDRESLISFVLIRDWTRRRRAGTDSKISTRFQQSFFHTRKGQT